LIGNRTFFGIPAYQILREARLKRKADFDRGRDAL